MKIHIEARDDNHSDVFELANIFRLNYDCIEATINNANIENLDTEEKTTVLTVEPRFDEDDGRYDVQRKVEKIADTIKLAFKLGVIK